MKRRGKLEKEKAGEGEQEEERKRKIEKAKITNRNYGILSSKIIYK